MQLQRLVFTPNPWPYVPGSQCSASCTLKGISFFFGSPCTLRDLSGAMTLLRFDITSSQPLRLHVDRGLRDMGTHGSPQTRVLEVPVKWTRPARSPANLQVGPETLSTIPMTLEDLRRPHPDSGRPAGLVAQASPLDRSMTPPVGPWIAGSAL
jgi:hypothetical protein